MSYPQVVRVFATTQEPDYDSPWQARPPANSTGSGVVVGPNQILTGAHVVANATFLQVQCMSRPDKATAQVSAVCHDADLALLTVPDGTLRDIRAAELGDLPSLRDKVSVVGFPVGGEEISITEGVVSRIEVQHYSHSQRGLLAVTVDAAINDGNSGGPVFMGRKVVGIAFQKLTHADSIGEMVPAPIIRNFLRAVQQGRPLRMPALSVQVQNLENPMMRRHVSLGPGETGVLVTTVEQGGSAWGKLQPRDVVLAINDVPIANNGTVRYRDRYRTRFDVLLSDYLIGDEIELRVLRGGERVNVRLQLKPAAYLVPRAEYDVAPSYFVYGGVVFQPLTRNLLTTWSKWRNRAPKEFLHYYYSGARSEERHQVVVVTQVLADEINVGFDYLTNESVAAVNGTVPRDMQHFVRMIDNSRGLVEITTGNGALMLFDTEAVKRATARILRRYQIGRDRSNDLLVNGSALPALAEAPAN